jgi:hypothetical protein
MRKGSKKTIVLLLSMLIVAFSFVPLFFLNVREVNSKWVFFVSNCLCIVVWLLLFRMVLYLSKDGEKKYRWLLVLLPVSAWPLFKTLFIFALWKLNGFAP